MVLHCPRMMGEQRCSARLLRVLPRMVAFEGVVPPCPPALSADALVNVRCPLISVFSRGYLAFEVCSVLRVLRISADVLINVRCPSISALSRGCSGECDVLTSAPSAFSADVLVSCALISADSPPSYRGTNTNLFTPSPGRNSIGRPSTQARCWSA